MREAVDASKIHVGRVVGVGSRPQYLSLETGWGSSPYPTGIGREAALETRPKPQFADLELASGCRLGYSVTVPYW